MKQIPKHYRMMRVTVMTSLLCASWVSIANGVTFEYLHEGTSNDPSPYYPRAVTNDGVAAGVARGVGTSHPISNPRAKDRPFVWKRNSGFSILPIAVSRPSSFGGEAYDISEDGRIVVGTTEANASSNQVPGQAYSYACRWVDGILEAVAPGSYNLGSHAYGCSADGSAIAGIYWDLPPDLTYRVSGFHRSLPGGSVTGIGILPQYSASSFGASYAHSISADGKFVVGISLIRGVSNDAEAIRWSAQTGLQGLGDLAGGSKYSFAHDVSSDGSVVVGYSTSSVGFSEIFRWTEETGMVGLGRSFDVGSPRGMFVTGDGNTILVGTHIWTAETGFVTLRQLVVDRFGEDFPDLQWGASAISADGNTLVGFTGYSTWMLKGLNKLPFINFFRNDANTFRVDFSGRLQRSVDLRVWETITPQPSSPYIFSTAEPKQFFRAITP